MIRAIASLGSVKLTPAAIMLLGVGVLVSYLKTSANVWWMVAPLSLLSMNLLAALVSNPRFRRQGGLLVFHICLLAVVVMVSAGRLTALGARVALVEGQDFDPDLVRVQTRGPWHPIGRLMQVDFKQGPIAVEYAPGLVRGATHSQVRLADGSTAVFGDTRPLSSAGYRFYTTSNKGFAAVLTWADSDGRTQAGAIHFPSYPLYDWKQVNRWITPAGTEVEVELALPQMPVENGAWTFDNRKSAGSTLLKLRWRNDAVELRSGQSAALPSGTLRFDNLRTWMGYRVTFDPLLPWLLATGLVGVGGLAWYFWFTLWSRPLAGPRTTNETHEHDVFMAHT